MSTTWHHAGGSGSELAQETLCANSSALPALPDSICFKEANQGPQATRQAEDSGRRKGTRQARESFALHLAPGPRVGSQPPARGHTE